MGSGGGRKKRTRKPRTIAPNSVYLKGLPEACADEDIIASLAGFGEVVNVSHRPGRDFAFAVFSDENGMNSAVGASGNVNVGGNAITVEVRTGKAPGAGAEEAKE